MVVFFRTRNYEHPCNYILRICCNEALNVAYKYGCSTKTFSKLYSRLGTCEKMEKNYLPGRVFHQYSRPVYKDGRQIFTDLYKYRMGDDFLVILHQDKKKYRPSLYTDCNRIFVINCFIIVHLALRYYKMSAMVEMPNKILTQDIELCRKKVKGTV